VNLQAVRTCWGDPEAAVTILTVAIGLRDAYMSVLHANRLDYAEKHGLEYCEYNQSIDQTSEPTWSKVAAILQLFEDPVHPRKRVQWLDADALIMNPQVSIMRDVVVEHARKDVVFSADFPAGRDEVGEPLNAGSIHLRNTHWTRRLLRRLYNTPQGRIDIFLSLFNGQYDAEQGAIMAIRDADPRDFKAHTAVVPWNVMNTLGLRNYREGDFILHAAGGGDRWRTYLFGRFTHRFGQADKYEQLEEFLLKRAEGLLAQRVRPSYVHVTLAGIHQHLFSGTATWEAVCDHFPHRAALLELAVIFSICTVAVFIANSVLILFNATPTQKASMPVHHWQDAFQERGNAPSRLTSTSERRAKSLGSLGSHISPWLVGKQTA
jgi:hypothetical protein